MIYMMTSIFTYNEFVNEYKTNRLSKNLKIYIIQKCFPEYKILKDFTSGFDKTNLGFYLIKIDKNN